MILKEHVKVTNDICVHTHFYVLDSCNNVGIQELESTVQ